MGLLCAKLLAAIVYVGSKLSMAEFAGASPDLDGRAGIIFCYGGPF
jgi:hypothetical protein